MLRTRVTKIVQPIAKWQWQFAIPTLWDVGDPKCWKGKPARESADLRLALDGLMTLNREKVAGHKCRVFVQPWTTFVG